MPTPAALDATARGLLRGNRVRFQPVEITVTIHSTYVDVDDSKTAMYGCHISTVRTV
jgi:hypothetical protein